MGGGGGGGGGGLKNHKNIGFPSKIDLDPLKITKLPGQPLSACQRNAIEMVLHWRADVGPLLVAFRSSL